MDPYIAIRSFTYPHDARIIKGRLEAEGIDCFLKDELTVQTDNFLTNALGGVKLQVKESDRKRAIDILKECGYLQEKDFQPTAFWKVMDSKTCDIPLLKQQPLEIRVMIVLAASVLLVIGVVWELCL